MAGSSASRSTSRPGCPGSRSSAWPTPRSRRPASGSAARSATPASSIPPRRITVNLAPAELRKAGASLDLAIAHRDPARVGAGPRRARARSRWSASCRWAARSGRCRASCRWSRRSRGAASARVVVRGRRRSRRRGSSTASSVVGVETLTDAAELRPASTAAGGRRSPPRADRAGGPRPDVAALGGTGRTRRVAGRRSRTWPRSAASSRRDAALEIALAGGHGLLLVGPPGSGKTLLARTIPGLLPPLDDAAALAVTIVASAAGEGPITELAAGRRSAPRTTRCRTRDGRRRAAAVAGRGHPGRPRGPVPRRAAGVRS